MFIFGYYAVFFCLLNYCTSQNESNCFTKEKCSDCIQMTGCVWCIKLKSLQTNITNHCIDSNNIPNNWCESDKIINPQASEEIIKDDPLQSDVIENVIQMKPQHVKLKLRKGEEHTITFQYRQAKNYPVDLYYIMDLSASMKNHKNKLGELGKLLAETMKNVTNNFRLGFGSFVDKVDLPFVSTVPEKLQAPCAGCVSPYSFINHLSLTDNAEEFETKVIGADVSGNLDAPEGGFDAIMQAIVCKKEIGWREQARHLIVFSTDADFHIAGDGKLAGVVEPNDAQCHMVNGKYIADLIYDYPSISQINYVAKKNNINIIFAIVKTDERIYKVYEQLQKAIENSGVGALDKKSSNVVNLIVEIYNKIVDTVRINDNSTNSVEIKYYPECKFPITNGCNNIHSGETVSFQMKIKPLECLAEGSIQRIHVKPEAVKEQLVIELETLCDCPCEKPNNIDYVPNAEECSFNGNSECGICNCNQGKFGMKCECENFLSNSNDTSNCKINPNDTEVCSGLGICKCGICKCYDREHKIYGKYCECDDYSCSRYNGELCSGPTHGRCFCGECECLAGWTGDACECPDSNSTCINHGYDDLICSGHGTCVCGECICNSDESHYTGKYCEDCASCPGKRCEELKSCVECQAYKTGEYNENECKLKCTEFETQLVDKIDEDNLEENEYICRNPDNYGCTIIFKYKYTEEKAINVTAQKTRQCPEKTNVLAIILSVIASIVIAGLVLLAVWKVFTFLHDRREYEKFEKEKARAKWETGDNPLYRTAVTNYSNPLYTNK